MADYDRNEVIGVHKTPDIIRLVMPLSDGSPDSLLALRAGRDLARLVYRDREVPGDLVDAALQVRTHAFDDPDIREFSHHPAFVMGTLVEAFAKMNGEETV